MPSSEDRDKLKCEHCDRYRHTKEQFGYFMSAHTIYPLVVYSEEDQVVIGVVADLVETVWLPT